MTNAQTLERTHKGIDKLARYGWTVRDSQGKFQSIPKAMLHVNNEAYQRDGLRKKILELASNWSWIGCGALIVAEREGVYWVVDGQHRKLAADRRSDIKELPCMVFQVDTVAQEARAFLSTNTNRKNVNAIDKFRAALAAGDPTAKKAYDAISQANLRVTTASIEPRAIKSVAMVQKLVADDYEGLCSVLNFCGELSESAKMPVHSRFLSGLYYLHCRIDEGVHNVRFRKRIKQIGMGNLVVSINKAAAYHGHAASNVCAEGILQAVNIGLHSKFMLATT